MKLSVIMPVFNEDKTIREIVKRVQNLGLTHEIIIVDDGSVDGTREILTELKKMPDVRVILHEHNQGKGAAVVTGMKAAVSGIMLDQDADGN